MSTFIEPIKDLIPRLKSPKQRLTIRTFPRPQTFAAMSCAGSLWRFAIFVLAWTLAVLRPA